MARVYERFRRNFINPFMDNNRRDYSSIIEPPTWIRSIIKNNAPMEVDVTVSLAEKSAGRQYMLRLYDTDKSHGKKEPLMSMDLEFDEKGSLTGLKDGAMTVYRVKNDMLQVFDYHVDDENPGKVKLKNAYKMRLDGDSDSISVLNREEQTRMIEEAGIPYEANWVDTAVAYLNEESSQRNDLTADFARNTTLIPVSSPVSA